MRITNPSSAKYDVPVHLDVPEIDVMWNGIGEIGITGVGAAVADTVYNANARRIRDLPITLDKLL